MELKGPYPNERQKKHIWPCVLTPIDLFETWVCSAYISVVATSIVIVLDSESHLYDAWDKTVGEGLNVIFLSLVWSTSWH